MLVILIVLILVFLLLFLSLFNFNSFKYYKKIYKKLPYMDFYKNHNQIYGGEKCDFIWFTNNNDIKITLNIYLWNNFNFLDFYSMYWHKKYIKWLKYKMDNKQLKKYMSYFNKEIDRDIFVSIKTDDDLKITKNKRYEIFILEGDNGIRFINDNNEYKELVRYNQYFDKIINLRRKKLKKILKN